MREGGEGKRRREKGVPWYSGKQTSKSMSLIFSENDEVTTNVTRTGM